MIKRLRPQEIHSHSRRRKRPEIDRWVLEPLDAILLTFAGGLVLWLKWLLAAPLT